MHFDGLTQVPKGPDLFLEATQTSQAARWACSAAPGAVAIPLTPLERGFLGYRKRPNKPKSRMNPSRSGFHSTPGTSDLKSWALSTSVRWTTVASTRHRPASTENHLEAIVEQHEHGSCAVGSGPCLENPTMQHQRCSKVLLCDRITRTPI